MWTHEDFSRVLNVDKISRKKKMSRTREMIFFLKFLPRKYKLKRCLYINFLMLAVKQIKTLFNSLKKNHGWWYRFVSEQRSGTFHYQYKSKENNYWSVVRFSLLNCYAFSLMSALLMRFEKSPLLCNCSFHKISDTQQYWHVSSMTVTKG